jgi:hypothetical protein
MTRHARVLYLGPPGAVQLPDTASVNDLMLATGRNTGNLLIGDAIRRQLRAERFETIGALLQRAGEPLTTPRLANFSSLNRRDIEADFDVVVIGASNFLFERFDFSNWATFLESVRLPCVIIGLGAQAPDYTHPVRVPDGTARMIRIIAERSKSLGVRGRFTAMTLEAMGLKNIRLIGCPSMYWTCEPALTVNSRQASERLAVSVNGSANVIAHSSDPDALRMVERMIARLSFDYGYPYILQNEMELMEIVRNGASAIDANRTRALMDDYGLSGATPESFIDYVRRHMAVFSDTQAWLSAVGRCDFVLGTRFHGCLVGLLTGVPCLIVVHDARTREMCELLCIPHLEARTVTTLDVDRLYRSLNLDELKATYSRRCHDYCDFLNENDLDHRVGPGACN